MKNAKWVISTSKEEAFVRKFDLREIDNEDKHDFFRLHYLERIRKVMEVIERHSPDMRILEIGAAQSNMSLLLAEKGFLTIALDINAEFLKYSRAKYETGNITWICANATSLPFQKESLGSVIIAELLEHCAYPEKILKEACGCLKEGGFLVITTPNVDCLINRQKRLLNMKTNRVSLKQRQFGPAGENHLFALSANEVVSMLPNNLKILGTYYLNSILLNSHTYSLYRCLPIKLLRRLQMIVSVLPVLRVKLCNSIMVYAQKQRRIGNESLTHHPHVSSA